ncbi:MAG: hypothetical protein A2913_02080 [Parcubacteria group bacterium RIFCSPLOWO2_01_FULL_40_65]|nr:MAG: hypothetical protein A2734_01280 [Parcubacteria group bacterium RIFCSPHIGHO2_01_FULL_40_30]OHB19516.1 MAG: hypothetical protein A3D40_02650 [Parcubacteria group bacterium RIFCSPHIGHO2_02_FULL_40_12]OHB21457.1 MAG: hypothetical protein A2913_02080 [Parcubacteria group bacterium RIFCSPLOWO2_01_FULL_40_65]OHB22979.1 MAG: hypothetical protein A3I22_00905 [Parcubacteria group bacterium RIFCSPLOWO2_02_FULL_40_12]
MKTSWEKDGFLFGGLSEEEAAKGGKWTVGDLLNPSEPGYSETVKYKSWVARETKYKPGSYPFKDRRDQGLWEYVITMKGVLIALERTPRNTHQGRYVLGPGKVAEFPPEALRLWELPPGCEEARGLTLLWSGEVIHAEEGLLGVTDNFFFESWTAITATNRLHRPKVNPLQYVEVFNGSLICTTEHGTFKLQADDHVYVQRKTSIHFEPESPETYGSVLYYQATNA